MTLGIPRASVWRRGNYTDASASTEKMELNPISREKYLIEEWWVGWNWLHLEHKYCLFHSPLHLAISTQHQFSQLWKMAFPHGTDVCYLVPLCISHRLLRDSSLRDGVTHFSIPESVASWFISSRMNLRELQHSACSPCRCCNRLTWSSRLDKSGRQKRPITLKSGRSELS